MLTAEEARKIASDLRSWPGGWGFILKPSTRSPRGYAPTGFHPKDLPCDVPDGDELRH